MSDPKISPKRPITKVTKPVKRFLEIEAASGGVLLFATAIALVAANTGFSESYAALWNTIVSIGVSGWELSYPLWYWVNDGLMAIFFFLVGLEIKREMVSGELRGFRKVVSPAVAALGGAAVPAIIYIFLLGDEPGKAGWAVPMATDIAFVVGALALLGKRVPHGLKVFLLTLAIVDDIIAVLIIAAFYSGSLKLGWLVGAVLGVGLVVLLNRLGVRTVVGYLIVGAGVWLCTLKSGIHPTISGVVLGLLTPAFPLISRTGLKRGLHEAIDEVDRDDVKETKKLKRVRDEVDFVSREAISPLERFETKVHPWAAFAIMPIFALANAGVEISTAAVSSTISTAVAAALVFGKPLGVAVGLFLVVKTRLGMMPGGANWGAVVGGGCLAGIGFTMSLFVASLGLEGAFLTQAKAGILIGSAVSGILGMSLLAGSLKGGSPAADSGRQAN